MEEIMDEDSVICACLGTTVRDIMDAAENGAGTVEEIEAATQAGTICGACLDEIGALLAKLKSR